MKGVYDMKQQVRKATKADVKLIHNFLHQVNLNTKGLDNIVDHFLLLENERGNITAMVAIESLGKKEGLLRSLVFKSETGTASFTSFFQGVIAVAKQQEIAKLYLLAPNETAVNVFKNFGFDLIHTIPERLQQSEHFIETKKKANPVVMVYQQ